MTKTNTNGETYQRNEVISDKEIKVTIRIPSNVRNKQEKINLIYNILKPDNSDQSA